jgi:hypothetical protein
MQDVVAWTFPGGKRVTKTVSATAGNVVTSLSPGTGKRWVVLRGIIKLISDATVGDRTVRFSTTDGTNITCNLLRTPFQAASLTRTYNFSEVTKLGDAAGGYDYNIEFPDNLLLEGSDELTITIDAGFAGDSYSGYIVLLEIDV